MYSYVHNVQKLWASPIIYIQHKTRQDMMSYGEFWCDMIRYDEIWWDIIRYDNIWLDMVIYYEIWWYMISYD